MAVGHYHGSCQCGAVDFDVDVDLDRTIICNCSRCRRLGSVLAFTGRDQFTLNRGEDSLSKFEFNKNRIQHLFCKTCGIEGFAYGVKPDGSPVVAVNANCLDGVDPRSLNSHAVDGASS